ncbi:MAG: hypothetical protein R6W74_06900 [Nitrosomonas halophila]
MKKVVLAKGAEAEEALRNYFINLGYYVVRGCKFRYKQFDVTDVDLWLYRKNSALTRERINVDIKNKKTPQALERVLWAKGLQSILKLDGCMVATTESREDVRRFGLQHGITVLDKEFLKRLIGSEKGRQERILEEQFLSDIDQESLGKLGGDWRQKYESGKSRFLETLNFDGCNAWLDDIGYFIEQSAGSGYSSKCVQRLVYFCVSGFLVSVDFVLREHAVSSQDQREETLNNGFRFGSFGKAYTDKIGKLAANLVVNVTNKPELGETVLLALSEQSDVVRSDILAEFLSKSGNSSAVFDIAREFESAAFDVRGKLPSELSVRAQSILGVLADFYGIDRKLIIA